MANMRCFWMIVSGGFAVVQPGSKLSINAVEAYTLDEFSSESVKNQLAEAQKIASGSGSEQDVAEAKIEIEVCKITYLYSYSWVHVIES